MKGWNRTITWTMAAVLFMATIPAYAEKTTPAMDSNSAVPADAVTQTWAYTQL